MTSPGGRSLQVGRRMENRYLVLHVLLPLVPLAVAAAVVVGAWKLFGVGKPRPPLRRAAVVAAWAVTVIFVLGFGFLALWSWSSGS